MWHYSQLFVCTAWADNASRNFMFKHYRCQQLLEIFTDPTSKFLMCFTVSSCVCRPFILNETTFTKYCVTQWICFEIHWGRHNLANFTGQSGVVNTTLFTRSNQFWQLKGLANVPNIYHITTAAQYYKTKGTLMSGSRPRLRCIFYKSVV